MVKTAAAYQTLRIEEVSFGRSAALTIGVATPQTQRA
jgi:hypothetical protein